MDKHQRRLHRLFVCITTPCTENFVNLEGKYGAQMEMHLEKMKCIPVMDCEYPHFEYDCSPENMSVFLRLVGFELMNERERLEKLSREM